MPDYRNPQAAISAILRASAIDGITWSDTGGSPFYERVPDQPPLFPYVVFDFEESSPSYTFENDYEELYQFDVRVVGPMDDIKILGSPYTNGSVFKFLDQFIKNPDGVSGDEWKCFDFARQGWSLKEDRALRGPEGERVYVARAPYAMKVSAIL